MWGEGEQRSGVAVSGMKTHRSAREKGMDSCRRVKSKRETRGASYLVFNGHSILKYRPLRHRGERWGGGFMNILELANERQVSRRERQPILFGGHNCGGGGRWAKKKSVKSRKRRGWLNRGYWNYIILLEEKRLSSTGKNGDFSQKPLG